MGKNKDSSALIDGLLRATLLSGVITVGLFAPNSAQLFDKPTQKMLSKLDKRARERELRRLTSYMKAKGLISGDYEHGLQITEKGKERLHKAEIDNIKIPKPQKWDKKWRMVFYDIPESKKVARNALSSKLREIGFQQLQRSVWVHPFPCREQIEAIAVQYYAEQYITYIETNYIDKQEILKSRFKKIL